MEALKSLIENLKEKLKTAWAEQQESPAFIALKERYEGLPPIAQKSILWGTAVFLALLVLWWPLSNLSDSFDFDSSFTERRTMVKELLKLQRDIASSPNVPIGTAPMNLKTQFEAKFAMQSVKPDQIKEFREFNDPKVTAVEQRGVQIQIDRLTIRQAVELGYELEHTANALKLSGLEIKANTPDPHYYNVIYKIVSFSPKLVPVEANSDLVNAIKGKGKTNESGAKPKETSKGDDL